MACKTMERRRVNWCELPPELFSMICHYLDAPVDILRFRSVCNTWRASFPPFQYGTLPPLPLKFPCPFATGKDAFLSETTIYRLEPSNGNSDPSSSTTLPSKSCLVKIEDTHSGELFSIRRVEEPNCPFPKDLSLLDFRLVKLGKSYGLDYLSYIYPVSGVTKVIRYPDTSSPSSASANYAEVKFSIFVIYDGGKLGYAKSGHRALTHIDVHDRITDYHDIIVHKGKAYVVDKWGTISCINDSSLELTQVSPPSSSIGLQLGGRKHLVESCGELYLVDRYFDPYDDTKANHQRPHVPYLGRIIRNGIVNPVVVRRNIIRGKTIGFKAYKLGNDWGNWVEVTNLGDRAFILNDDIAFSVSASEFDGCRGNCIYFKDRNKSNLFAFGRNVSVFNLEDRSISKVRWSKRIRYSNMHLNRKLWILDCSNSSEETACVYLVKDKQKFGFVAIYHENKSQRKRMRAFKNNGEQYKELKRDSGGATRSNKQPPRCSDSAMSVNHGMQLFLHFNFGKLLPC